MTLFLTSSPTGPLDGSRPVEGFDTMNRFRENLKRFWPDSARVLMITASPDEYTGNDRMIDFFRNALDITGLTFSCLHLMDRRYAFTPEEIIGYDVIFLGGGHTPTQNAYFKDIGLREVLTRYGGIVIGISAGSMNCAETVYFEPELPGEATDPGFIRFSEGLGLTTHKILPHYQMVREQYFDGISFDEVNFPFSFRCPMLALDDGSYLLSENGKETVWGHAYVLRDGILTEFCTTDCTVEI